MPIKSIYISNDFLFLERRCNTHSSSLSLWYTVSISDMPTLNDIEIQNKLWLLFFFYINQMDSFCMKGVVFGQNK